MTAAAPLSPAARATLRELADALIPGGAGQPSASTAGVADVLIDRVLAVRLKAAPSFVALLERLAADPGPGTPTERAQRLRRDHPTDFQLLAGFVVGAWQLAEPVRAAIGYPGQGPSDVTFEDETGYVTEGLLDPVLERGPRAPGI
ncbi:MAG: hypothetical protein U0869_23910 [Chloroflexota bacterium]